MDVIEIDAASNRGINEMRELRENVRYRPARDRYKVFIVDEAHQITSEAFNALLKTLEEPPEWVVFILCTTEAHKIPTTIASRCQQFSFRSVDFAELVKRMEEICEQEGIEADRRSAERAGAGRRRQRARFASRRWIRPSPAAGASWTRPRCAGCWAVLAGFAGRGDATRCAAEDSRRDARGGAELERNGRSLQHFARELARYFRNLLVVKIAGAEHPADGGVASASRSGWRRRRADFQRRRSDAVSCS